MIRMPYLVTFRRTAYVTLWVLSTDTSDSFHIQCGPSSQSRSLRVKSSLASVIDDFPYDVMVKFFLALVFSLFLFVQQNCKSCVCKLSTSACLRCRYVTLLLVTKTASTRLTVIPSITDILNIQMREMGNISYRIEWATELPALSCVPYFLMSFSQNRI